MRELTTREKEILLWIAEGKSNPEIGKILTISPLTVKNHVQKILKKLNVVNRAQAIGLQVKELRQQLEQAQIVIDGLSKS